MAGLLTVDWTQIPAPEDDGATKHLTGMKLPSLFLPATNGEHVDLSILQGRSVIYAYPMTGRPDVPLPDGWDMIPGARGCTPQSCAFRDLAHELKVAGADHIFGLSTQSTDYQVEVAERLHLPFPLLSDVDMLLTSALKLPTFIVSGAVLLKRLTMVMNNGQIEHIFYPIFPPDQNATDVVDWLTVNPVAV
jgi:peroxiredoxin